MGLFDTLTSIAGTVLSQQTKKQEPEPAKETNWLDTLSKVAATASGNNNTAAKSNGGGLLDSLQNLQTTATTIAAVKNVMDGKIDLKTIGTLLMAYFTSQGNSKKEAQEQGNSIASSIANAINLDTVKSVTDLVGKLNSSDKPGTTDMATILTSAVTSLISKK